MREQIQRFMREAPEAKSRPFANNPFATLVTREIPESIYETGLVDREKYLVQGSAGKGNWARVPWICIFDRSITTTARKGEYIAYLLSADGKQLYLTFMLGCTELREQNSKRETFRIMHEKVENIRATVPDQGFASNGDIDLGIGLTELGEMYQQGTVYYKRYDVDAVPEEAELRDDLARMMSL